MNELMVTGTKIRQDEQGRYCLNDLHKAAGGENKNSPWRWLRYSQANELIKAIDAEKSDTYLGAAPVLVEAVKNPSTYGVKELVYAYAMWISPTFHLRVIRAYDALISGEFIQPSIQVENYWFARRPHWPPIRMAALAGHAYRDIAAALQISRGRVARAVKSMINVGLLDPRKVSQVQKGPARKAALRYAEGWGLPIQSPAQLPLFG
jgi:hypothetical protein